MRAAERVVEHPLGEQIVSERHAHAYSMNTLLAYAPLPPGLDGIAFAEALDELQADMAHRGAFVADDAGGGRLAPVLRAQGFIAEHNVFMELSGERDRSPEAGALAVEVDADTLREVTRRVVAEQLPAADATEIEHVVTARDALAATCSARFFLAGGAATATLYSDGRVAQIEDVGTLRARRRQGLARAAVSAAVDAARAQGHELIFIVADDDDWPKELYAKLGFSPIGRAWVFTRLPRRPRG